MLGVYEILPPLPKGAHCRDSHREACEVKKCPNIYKRT